MINKSYLKFEVLTKSKKDLFKTVQSNAKFKTLSDVVKTKVGINNFYNFSIAIKSSIVMRDIIMNSGFVSGWARSSQVLNKTDSKFAGYRFLTKDELRTKVWIQNMEHLQSKGHSQDNMRSLIYLDSVNDYAINLDLLHLLYLELVLDDMFQKTEDDLKDEIGWFVDKIHNLLYFDYELDYQDFKQMLPDALRDFPAINCSKLMTLKEITGEQVYDVNATYSVIGQIWRHRTLVKQYGRADYQDLVVASKALTEKYNYDEIGMHEEIAKAVKDVTSRAESIYELCQGSIVPFKFSGTTGAVHKALSQRTCFINDSPQFKDAFDDFLKAHPDLKLLPPCKLNATRTNSCYVGYVNESRLRGEELTQKVCPIYAKAHGYDEAFKDSVASPKTQWYIKNLDMWSNVCHD